MTRARLSTIRLATGPTVHYAEQGDVDGHPVVLLHGWPDSWFSFSRVLESLPGVRAFVLDQRGFGRSERPDAGYDVDQFAADVVAFLDATSIERATIVGHSFGSFVARRVAIAHPARVTRLVLIGTGLSAANAVTREVQSTLRDLPNPVPIEFARDFQASTIHVPLPEWFFDRMLAESMSLPAWFWREVLDRLLTYDDAEQLARISAPTLLLWGDRDALFPRSDQDAVIRAIPGATLKVYSETGHCPNWERPEEVAADLTAFVRSIQRDE